MNQSKTLNLPLITIFLGGLSLAIYSFQATSSQHYGDLSLSPFLLTSFTNALICFFVWSLHKRQEQQINMPLLLGFAVAFRLVGTATFPILEDDFYRYLWDAHQTWQLGTPYGPSPSAYFDVPLNLTPLLADRFELVLDSINYPDVATIYGPTTQWFFALAYLIAPGEVWPLQWLLALLDLVLIGLLLKLAKPNSVLLYAWCPLIIKEFTITAHPDLIGAVLIVAALFLHRDKHFYWLGCVVALAVGVKIFAVLLVPFFLQFNWRVWLIFVLTAVSIALPFGFVEAWLPSGLSAMSRDWLFNAPLYLLLSPWLSISLIKTLLLAILGVFCAIQFLNYFQQRHSLTLIEGLKGDCLYGLLFLCAPVFNPWYLVWLLPFAVIRSSAWAWVLSVTALLSYASGINLPDSTLEPYAHPDWIIALEFIPVLIAIGFTMIIKKREPN